MKKGILILCLSLLSILLHVGLSQAYYYSHSDLVIINDPERDSSGTQNWVSAYTSSGQYFTAATGNMSSIEYNPTSQQIYFIAGYNSTQYDKKGAAYYQSDAIDMTFDNNYKNLYYSTSSSTIYQRSTIGQQQTSVFYEPNPATSGISSLYALAFDPSGNLFVSALHNSHPCVLEIDPSGIAHIFSELSFTGTIYGLAFNDAGVLFASLFDGPDGIYTFDAAGHYTKLPIDVTRPDAIAFVPSELLDPLPPAPVPVPSTLLLLGSGLLGLGGWRGFRKS